jgi:hypothetical protein
MGTQSSSNQMKRVREGESTGSVNKNFGTPKKQVKKV